MRPAHKALIASAIGLLAACGKPEDPTATASTDAPAPAAAAASPVESAAAPLTRRLDCLRESGGVLLVGHRGGPNRDYPENAIETFERTFKAGTRAMEIDPTLTKDGVPILMHDEDLDRTSTGTGMVADQTWADIANVNLETYSKVTDFHPPTLEAALEWAVANGALVEVDKKRETPFPPLVAAIRKAKAENNVFVITHTDAQAIEMQRDNPDLVITATVRDAAHLDALIARGVKPERLVAWTGTETPDPALWKALAARGIEAAFGTLGPRSTSLDGQYWSDDDGSEYDTLVTGGLTILVTDLTDKVSRQLAAPMAKAKACGF